MKFENLLLLNSRLTRRIASSFDPLHTPQSNLHFNLDSSEGCFYFETLWQFEGLD